MNSGPKIRISFVIIEGVKIGDCNGMLTRCWKNGGERGKYEWGTPLFFLSEFQHHLATWHKDSLRQPHDLWAKNLQFLLG